VGLVGLKMVPAFVREEGKVNCVNTKPNVRAMRIVMDPKAKESV